MLSININDVKKGWEVYTRDRQVQWVEDNKKGLIRMVKAHCVNGGFELGSTYAFRWYRAKDLETNEVFRTSLTPAQEKKAKMIQQAGF